MHDLCGLCELEPDQLNDYCWASAWVTYLGIGTNRSAKNHAQSFLWWTGRSPVSNTALASPSRQECSKSESCSSLCTALSKSTVYIVLWYKMRSAQSVLGQDPLQGLDLWPLNKSSALFVREPQGLAQCLNSEYGGTERPLDCQSLMRNECGLAHKPEAEGPQSPLRQGVTTSLPLFRSQDRPSYYFHSRYYYLYICAVPSCVALAMGRSALSSCHAVLGCFWSITTVSARGDPAKIPSALGSKYL